MASDDKKAPGSPQPPQGRKPVTLDLSATEKRPEGSPSQPPRGDAPSSAAKPVPRTDDAGKTAGAAPKGTAEKPAAPASRADVEANKPGEAKTGAGAVTAGTAPDAGPAAAKPAQTKPPETKPASGASSTSKPAEAVQKTREPIPSAFAIGARPGGAGSAPAAAKGGTSFPALLAAALLGGLIGAGALWAAGQSGLLNPGGEDARLAEMQASLEALQAQSGAAQAGASQAGTDEALAARVSAIEAEFGGLSDADLEPVRQRLDALEAAEPGTVDGAAVTELRSQVETLTSQLAALSEAAQAEEGAASVDLSPVEARLDRLDESVAALQSRPQGLPPEAEEQLSAQQQRLDALEGRLGELATASGAAAENAEAVAALRAELDATQAQANRVPELAESLSAGALADALDTGAAFEAELAAARANGIADPALEALAARAGSGVPTLAALRSRFDSEVAPKLVPRPEPEPEPQGPAEIAGGALDRLFTSARDLVEVRPAKPTAEPAETGDEAARIRAALEEGDLAAALSEWRGLPEDAKAATRGWADDAEARLAADDIAATLRADSLARLAPKS